MGREERFPSTGYLPAPACWLCYGLVALAYVFVFLARLDLDPWYTGLTACMLTTFLVFCFAFSYRNTSIYDPYWCWYPLFSALAWMATARSMPSARGCYTLGLLLAWFMRYNIQWPWEGWTRGIDTEDWRYPMMAKKLGLSDSTGPIYWILISLLGSHIVPTLLVWFVLAPMQNIWTAGASGYGLGLLDLIAAIISLGGVALQFVADRTLLRFRARNIRADTDVSIETQVCSKICREGPWGHSRHPNYLGEVLFWLGMDLAAIAGGWTSFVGSLGGILIYACFFRVSASLMDKRSLVNRPGYGTVMQEVSALVPCPMFIDSAIDRILIPVSKD